MRRNVSQLIFHSQNALLEIFGNTPVLLSYRTTAFMPREFLLGSYLYLPLRAYFQVNQPHSLLQ